MQFSILKSSLRNLSCVTLFHNTGCARILIRRLSTEPTDSYRMLSNQNFFQKQIDLKRPLSPFISIYKPQLTWTMSITFRATEVFIASTMSSLILYLFFMNYNSFPELLASIKDLQLPFSLSASAKFLYGVPFSFFIIGGLRHTAWDLGYGFELRTLYKTAYATMVLSLLGGLAIALIRV